MCIYLGCLLDPSLERFFGHVQSGGDLGHAEIPAYAIASASPSWISCRQWKDEGSLYVQVLISHISCTPVIVCSCFNCGFAVKHSHAWMVYMLAYRHENVIRHSDVLTRDHVNMNLKGTSFCGPARLFLLICLLSPLQATWLPGNHIFTLTHGSMK